MNRYRMCISLVALGLAVLSAQHFAARDVSPPPREALAPGYNQYGMTPIFALAPAAFARRLREDALSYTRRMTRTVYLSTYHCKMNGRPPTWLQIAASLLLMHPSALSYGVLLRERFTCGFCHQRAHLLRNTLRDAGLDADVLGLNGHVVTRVRLGDEIYLADPDYGVGPMPADQSAATIQDIYRASAMGNILKKVKDGAGSLNDIARFYLTEDDNVPYTGLDEATTWQRRIFAVADVLAYVFIVAAVLLFASAFLIRRGIPYGLPPRLSTTR